jgi:C-terminal processing protease CtpA/Prc
MLDQAVGYLSITAFYGYAEGSTYEGELRALRLALDSIFQNANTLNGLVIDVRLNHGGDDPLGIEIASRFTDSRYLAYAKEARNNRTGPLRFTVPQQIWVEPSSQPGFHGDIILLTGPDTVSAGETFAMALVGRKPRILRIGANTQGVFSDVLNRTLPNGWTFRLPNEIYLTADGKAFDGTGLPPDVPVHFFMHEDLNIGRDAALEEAQNVLPGNRMKPAGASP